MMQQLLSELENKELESLVCIEDLSFWNILKKQNKVLKKYWKKLIENDYIAFVNATFENNNQIFHLTCKEAYIKKYNIELHITQIKINHSRSFNSSSTLLSSNTLTTFCLFNLGSLDHNGHLSSFNETAKYGTSFLSGDIFLASSRNCEYPASGTILILFDSNSNETSNSSFVNPETFVKYGIFLLTSSIKNSGDTRSYPAFFNFANKSILLEPGIKTESTIFASTTIIYNNPCLLAMPPFILSPILNVSSSVSLLLDTIFFNKAISNSSCNSFLIALISREFQSISFVNSLTSFSYPFGTSNSTFIDRSCGSEYLNLRVTSEQNPYFDSFSTSLSTPSTTVPSTNYTFDTLGRVTFVRNPDGSNKTINFDHRIITAYDENGHRKTYVLDGYDRIQNILEYNNDPVLNWNFESDTYNTSYEYDTSDNLVKITDTDKNVISEKEGLENYV